MVEDAAVATPARISTREIRLDAHAIAPQVTWGTNPEDVLPITGVVPDPADVAEDEASARRCSACSTTWASRPARR